MRIGVCDEEEMWLVKSENVLNIYGRQQKLDLSVFGFQRGEDLKAYDGMAFHVLFIDIELDDNHGVALACQVIEQWPDCQIVFLTKELSGVLAVYQVRHLCVVLKGELEKRLSGIMDIAMQKLRSLKKRIVFKIHGKAHLILAPEEIVWLERDKRITRIVSSRGEFITNEKLGQLIERLPMIDFVRCHNSYIVYIPAVKVYEKDMFIMKDGKTIIISRGYEEKTKKAYERWERLKS